MKKREWIDDYFIQLTAYAAAHNEMYGTDIRQGVILMASQDGLLKEFIVCGREFDSYLDQWNAKVKEFTALAAASGLQHLSETASDTSHYSHSAVAGSASEAPHGPEVESLPQEELPLGPESDPPKV